MKTKSSSKARPELIAKKILIVDDALDIQIVLRKFLERSGASVEIATTGTQALQIAKGKDYDLVLLDIHLPDMSGYEVMAELRRTNFDSPVFAFTALDDNFLNKSKFFELGFAGLLSKDFIKTSISDFPDIIADLFNENIIFKPNTLTKVSFEI